MRWFALLPPIVLAAVVCGGSNAQEPAATRTIAFVRGSQVWTMNADESEQRRLTRARGGKGGPIWSPDGRRIAYTSPGPGKDGSYLFVVNADGTGERRLTRPRRFNYVHDGYLDWSPDGAQDRLSAVRLRPQLRGLHRRCRRRR